MDYESFWWELPPDKEGPNRALAQRAIASASSDLGVLYLPGFSDTYFHHHVAKAVTDLGIQFWLLEPRKCGRARLKNQTPHGCSSLDELHPEILLTARKMMAAGVGRIVILGHSMGGLVAVHFARAAGRELPLAALVLNSPFFGFNIHPVAKAFLPAVVSSLAGIFPTATLSSGVAGVYGESLHRDFKGEWNFDRNVKPVPAHKPTLAMLKAVHVAQQAILWPPLLEMPITIFHSDHSWKGKAWDDDVSRSDAVLNVEDMKRIGPKIGLEVTLVELKGALHDVFLSAPPVREEALRKLSQTLKALR